MNTVDFVHAASVGTQSRKRSKTLAPFPRLSLPLFFSLSLISSRSIQGGAAARACGAGPAGANGGAALGPAVGLAGSRASALVPGCSTKQKESETERENEKMQ